MQAFNKRTQSWVKYKLVKGKGGGKFPQFFDVKQNNSKFPFKNIKITVKKSNKKKSVFDIINQI